jgi:hypothetical protein
VPEEAKWNPCWGGLAAVAWKKGGVPSGPSYFGRPKRSSCPPLGGGRAGEVRVGRFLHNPRVTREMLATAHARTAGLVKGRHVPVIQDTTSLRDDGDQRSLHPHPAVAVDAKDGALLGLVHAVFLHRTGGKRGQHNNQPFAEK